MVAEEVEIEFGLAESPHRQGTDVGRLGDLRNGWTIREVLTGTADVDQCIRSRCWPMEGCTTPDARAHPGTEGLEDVGREGTEAPGEWDQEEGEGRREGSPS